jgi:hypothetical protein
MKNKSKAIKTIRRAAMTLMLACCLPIQSHAQAIQFPTIDLFDSDMMQMYANALNQTYNSRKETYHTYVDMAFEAAKNDDWLYVVRYLDKAFETKFWNEDLYFLRGLAYEHLGNNKQAKRDYKEGKNKGSSLAAEALERLKAEEKRYK